MGGGIVLANKDTEVFRPVVSDVFAFQFVSNKASHHRVVVYGFGTMSKPQHLRLEAFRGLELEAAWFCEPIALHGFSYCPTYCSLIWIKTSTCRSHYYQLVCYIRFIIRRSRLYGRIVSSGGSSLSRMDEDL